MNRQLRLLNSYLTTIAGADIAELYGQRIVTRCLALGDLPFRGRARPELGRGLRSIPFERRATVFYRVRRKRVEITALSYGGQDLARALRR